MMKLGIDELDCNKVFGGVSSFVTVKQSAASIFNSERRKNNYIYHIICLVTRLHFKLDGVGPVDNRPSTDKLHHFAHQKNVTCDT